MPLSQKQRADFLKKVRKLPKSPGVYFIKDSSDRTLYIGKAKSLRDRVASYARSEQVSPKIAAMIPQMRDVDYLETDSEIEALLAEQRLVKDIKPRYNTELKDDKTFPSLEITMGDDFPAIRYVRQYDDPDSRYFGPFTDANSLRRAIKVLQKIFRFRTCSLTIKHGDRSRRYARPCLLFYIKQCSAPCTDNISSTEYGKDINKLIDLLVGEKEKILEELRGNMSRSSSRLAFEQAARYRNQLKALEALRSAEGTTDGDEMNIGPISPESGVAELQDRLHLDRPPRIIEGIDISNISGKQSAGSKVTFIDGVPFKSGYRRYRIKTEKRDDYAMITEVIRRRFSRFADEETTLPDLLLIDGGAGHVGEAARALKDLGLDVPCIGLAKKHEEIFLPNKLKPLRLASNDTALRMLQCVRDEAHRFARHYHHLMRGKRLKK